MPDHGELGHECVPLRLAVQVYKGDTGDGTGIWVDHVYAPDGASGDDGVALTLADTVGGTCAVVDPEHALEIAAGITTAAHCALWRREMGRQA